MSNIPPLRPADLATEASQRTETHVGSSTDERAFASTFGQLGPEATPPHRGISDLPTELLQQTMRDMRPQDMRRFSETSQRHREIVQNDATLSATLAHAQSANRTMGRLKSEGRLDPTNPTFAVSHIRLGRDFPFIEEGEGDDLIRATVNIPDERLRSTAIGTAVRNWADLSSYQRDTLLSGAITIRDPQQLAGILKDIGHSNLRLLDTRQQTMWVTAVLRLPSRQRLSVVSESNASQLSDQSHRLLRGDVASLPASLQKNLALRKLGPAR